MAFGSGGFPRWIAVGNQQNGEGFGHDSFVARRRRRYRSGMNVSDGSRRALCAVWMVALLGGCGADHHARQGKDAQDAHDLPAAERHYRDAIARDPEHVDALAGLGWVYLLAGQTDAADAAFTQCRKADAGNAECLRGAASVASAKGNPGEAQRLLNDALQRHPQHSGVLSSAALLDLAAGRVDQALRRYRQLVDREPERAEYRLGIAEALMRSKAHEEALTEIEGALALPDAPKRTRAMLLQTQARALVAASARRVDPESCETTAAPVRAWLDAADRAVDLAETVGVTLPELPVVERRIRNQRARVSELCPG